MSSRARADRARRVRRARSEAVGLSGRRTVRSRLFSKWYGLALVALSLSHDLGDIAARERHERSPNTPRWAALLAWAALTACIALLKPLGFMLTLGCSRLIVSIMYRQPLVRGLVAGAGAHLFLSGLPAARTSCAGRHARILSDGHAAGLLPGICGRADAGQSDVVFRRLLSGHCGGRAAGPGTCGHDRDAAPAQFQMNRERLIMLAGIYYGAKYGGSTPPSC